MPAGKYLVCAAAGSSWWGNLTLTGGTEILSIVQGDGNNSGYAGLKVNYVNSTSSTTIRATPANSQEYLVVGIIKLST